jgi:hypothetical protein
LWGNSAQGNASTWSSKPLDLLAKVKGVEVVDLARPDECCGFGGTFCVLPFWCSMHEESAETTYSAPARAWSVTLS